MEKSITEKTYKCLRRVTKSPQLRLQSVEAEGSSFAVIYG